MKVYRRWRVYFIGEVFAETFQAACRRAAHRFGNRAFTIVPARNDG